MDVIYRAMWRHRENAGRRGEGNAGDSGTGSLLRLALALVAISGCIGLLDVAASRTQRDKDAEGIVIVQTREGD